MDLTSSASSSSDAAFVAGRAATDSGLQRPAEAGSREASLSALVPVLEQLDEGVVLMYSSEFECFENTVARELFADDVERGTLIREMRALARKALQAEEQRSPECEVDTAAGRYRIRATVLGRVMRETQSRAVLVLIDRISVQLPSLAMLMRRFWLTAREAEVALLLAEGMRNASIARRLDLSPNTVRHYTESVLLKFGVHSRAEVELVILTLGGSVLPRSRTP